MSKPESNRKNLHPKDDPLVAPEAGSLIAEEGIETSAPVPPAWKRLLRGPEGILASSVVFSLMNYLVKIATDRLPSGEVTFSRFLFGTLFLGLLGWSGKLDIRARQHRLLITRGLLGSCAILLLFTALSKTSLTNAILLGNTYVLFGAVFSYFVLNEGMGIKVGISLMAALLGSACILRPDLHHVRAGDLLALGHGVVGGAAITVVRGLRRAGSESPWAILFYLSLVGTMTSLAMFSQGWRIPALNDLFLLFLIGAFGTLGQAMLTYAYRWCTTAEGGILSLLVVPLSAGLGVLFLNEQLAVWDWAGAALILLSSVYVVWDNRPKG